MILDKVLIHSLWLDFATATEKYTSLVDTKLALYRFSNGEIGLIIWKDSMQGGSFQKTPHNMYTVSLKLTSRKNLASYYISRQIVNSIAGSLFHG
jgi:hypothetical protein